MQIQLHILTCEKIISFLTWIPRTYIKYLGLFRPILVTITFFFCLFYIIIKKITNIMYLVYTFFGKIVFKYSFSCFMHSDWYIRASLKSF